MKRLTRLKAISFDGDMTLWDFDKVMRHSLGCALAELRVRRPGSATAELTVDTMIEIRETVADEMRGTTDLEAIRLQAFRRTLASIGAPDDDLAAHLNALYLRHRFEEVELYPDVLPALERLGDRYSLGLVSNGNGYPSLRALADRFAFLVFSQDTGVEKPDPRIFLHACELAGCAPDELMHVGDSLQADVAGANAVGSVSVWLNRDGGSDCGASAADYAIRTLDELASIVGVDAQHLTSA